MHAKCKLLPNRQKRIARAAPEKADSDSQLADVAKAEPSPQRHIRSDRLPVDHLAGEHGLGCPRRQRRFGQLYHRIEGWRIFDGHLGQRLPIQCDVRPLQPRY